MKREPTIPIHRSNKLSIFENPGLHKQAILPLVEMQWVDTSSQRLFSMAHSLLSLSVNTIVAEYN